MMDGALPSELEAFHQLARALRTQLDRRSVLESIVNGAKELLACEVVVISLKDFTRPVFVLAASAGGANLEELPIRPHTVSGRAFHENRPVVENAYDRSPHAVPILVEHGYHALMATPLCDSGRPIGVVVAGHAAPGRSFTAGDVRLLETFVALAEIALSGADRAVEVMRRSARVEAMQSVIQELAESYDLKEIAQRALDTALTLFSADRGGAWLNEGEKLTLLSSRGLSSEYLQVIATRGSRLPVFVSAAQRPVFVNDVQEPRFAALHEHADDEGFRCLLGIPATFRGRTIGRIVLYHDIPWSYTQEDLSLATTLGQQLGVAIANAQLVSETNRQLGRVGALSEIGRAVTETLDLSARCERSVRSLSRTGALDAVMLYLLDGGTLYNVARFPSDLDLTGIDRIEMTKDRLLVRAVAGVRVASTDEPDVPQRSQETLAAHGFKHGVAVPMANRGKIVGGLLAGRREQPFSADDIEFVRIAANQIAASVEHARVFAQLSETGGRLHAILRCAPEGILVFGTDTRIVYYNAEALRIYSLEGTDVTSWTTDDFKRAVQGHFADPEVAEEIARRLHEEAGRVHRMEYELVYPVRRIIERSSAPVLGDAGEFLGQVVLLHDITTLRDAQNKSRPSDVIAGGAGATARVRAIPTHEP